MAHYAFIDENNIVTEVITGRNENEIVDGISNWEEYYGSIRNQRCIRTSYNANIRANFATVGSFYDEEKDVFIPVKPFDSWILNSSYQWEPPIPLPSDAYTLDNLDGVFYNWDETSGSWKEMY